MYFLKYQALPIIHFPYLHLSLQRKQLQPARKLISMVDYFLAPELTYDYSISRSHIII